MIPLGVRKAVVLERKLQPRIHVPGGVIGMVPASGYHGSIWTQDRRSDREPTGSQASPLLLEGSASSQGKSLPFFRHLPCLHFRFVPDGLQE